MVQEKMSLAKEVEEANEKLSTKDDEIIKLRTQLQRGQLHSQQTASSLKLTAGEREKAAFDAAQAKIVVRHLRGRNKNASEEVKRLSGLLDEQAELNTSLSKRLGEALKERDDALESSVDEREEARRWYENEFLTGQWLEFEEAYRAFEHNTRRLQKERDQTAEELEALRNRLRSSKHLPHIGVQWALWGNGPKPKGATTQVHPAPQEEPQHQAHRAAPTLPRWPERLPNKRSASSIAMRPKR